LLAGGFANQAVVGPVASSFQLFGDPDYAVDGSAFLVAGQHQAQLALVVGMLHGKRFQRHHHRGDGALHVGHAPAIQFAVLFIRVKRQKGPQVLWPGWHNVGMAQEPE